MKVRNTLLVASLILAMLPIASLAAPGDIWLADSYLFKVRTAAGGYTIDQRADELQARANDLLQVERQIPPVSLETAGNDVNIYAGCKLFATVTAADASVNNTTVGSLAAIWAHRLEAALPQAAAYKPGIGTCPMTRF